MMDTIFFTSPEKDARAVNPALFNGLYHNLSYFVEVLEFAALRGSSIADTSFGSREKTSGCSDLSLGRVGGMSPLRFARFTLYSTKRFIALMSPDLET